MFDLDNNLFEIKTFDDIVIVTLKSNFILQN
jgi:hypothetical protein